MKVKEKYMDDITSIINEINSHKAIRINGDTYILGFNQKIKESKMIILCGNNKDVLFLDKYVEKFFEKNIIQVNDIRDLEDKYKKETILIVGDEEYQWEQYKKSREMMCDRAYVIDRTLKELICTFAE